MLKALDILSCLITVGTFILSLTETAMLEKVFVGIYPIYPFVFAYLCFRTCIISKQFNIYKKADELVREITRNIGCEKPANPLTKYCYVFSICGVGYCYWRFCNSLPIENAMIHNLLGIDILLLLLTFCILLFVSVKRDCDVYEALRKTGIVTPVLGIVTVLVEIILVLAWCMQIQ